MALHERYIASVKPMELPEPWRSAALAVVLPTYNEAANLPVIVGRCSTCRWPGSGSWSQTTIRQTVRVT